MTELLTSEELELIDLLARCTWLAGRVVSDGRTRDADLVEFCHHIHACQQQVMSQAAARAYPDRFRLLGGPPLGCRPADPARAALG